MQVVISDPQHRVLKSHKSKMGVMYMYIYVIMKTIYPPGYKHNGFMATKSCAVPGGQLVLIKLCVDISDSSFL